MEDITIRPRTRLPRLRPRGFPNREQLVERLQGYQQHLEGELKNVQELLERLGDAPEQPAASHAL